MIITFVPTWKREKRLLSFKKSNVFYAACFISDFSENCWEFHCCPIHIPQHLSLHNEALKKSSSMSSSFAGVRLQSTQWC